MLGSWWGNAQHLLLEKEKGSGVEIKAAHVTVYNVGHSLLDERRGELSGNVFFELFELKTFFYFLPVYRRLTLHSLVQLSFFHSYPHSSLGTHRHTSGAQQDKSIPEQYKYKGLSCKDQDTAAYLLLPLAAE